MNSLYTYYNNVQKMAAYRQAKRRQCGVKLGDNELCGSSSAVKFISNPIPVGTDDFTVEFYGTMYGSNSSYASLFNAVNPTVGGKKTFSFYNQFYPDNGIYGVLFSPDTSGDNFGDQVEVIYRHGDDSKFLVSVTRQGMTVKVYINGKLKATKEQSEVKDLGDLQLAIANSSDVGFVRVWNMCLSADDVTAHYNNGDPMGYVVPKAEKDMIPIEITSANTYTWDEEHTVVYHQLNFTPAPLPGVRKYRVNVTVSNYEAGIPYFYTGKFYYIPPQNGTYDILVDIGTKGYEKMFPMYGGQSTTTRKLTLTVNSVTPVGLIAEYLPQNLMESRKGPEVEPKAKIYEFNTGDEYYKSVISGVKYPFDCIYRVDYVVNEWDYQPKSYGSVGFLGISGATILTPDSQYWSTLEKAKVGEPRYLLIKMPGAGNPALYVYGGNDNDVATARHLKVTIKGVTPVSIPLSWLDSAKQSPLSDEYLPPLFQSIGGYDMTANGAPEILYNE